MRDEPSQGTPGLAAVVLGASGVGIGAIAAHAAGSQAARVIAGPSANPGVLSIGMGGKGMVGASSRGAAGGYLLGGALGLAVAAGAAYDAYQLLAD